MTKCPECASQRVWKDGVRHTKYGDVQRYLCRACGFRFSDPQVKRNIASQIGETFNSRSNFANVKVGQSDFTLKKIVNDSSFPFREDVGSHIDSYKPTIGKGINTLLPTVGNTKVCVSDKEAKNLVKVESQLQEAKRGATKPSKAEMKGEIINFLLWMKNQGYAKATMVGYGKNLENLVKRGADLLNPQSIKEVIARQETWSAGTKIYVVDSYSCYLKMKGLTWEKPRYKRREKTKFIPLEEEIDALIIGCGKKTATFLQGLKETGCDPTELWRIKWIDIDKANMRVSINHPVKGHNARKLPISEKWIAMVERLPKKSEWVFGKAMYHTYYSNFARQRRRIATRLDNPRILKITFTSIRHWKATTEYHRTHDILHVKHMLGHKHLLSTEVYVHLAEELFSNPKDMKFITRAAVNTRGCRMLAEAGFEKFDEINGVHLYRRRR